MPRATAHPSAHAAPTPGAAWVDRYLVPRLAEQMPTRSLTGLRVLQLDPDDADEAQRCAELGASVTLAALDPLAFDTDAFPVFSLDPNHPIFAPDAAFDLILTGHLERLASRWSSPEALLRECARICAPGGGMVTQLSTRCPINLTGDAPLLAFPRRASPVSLRALERAFGAAIILPVRGHFGWRSSGIARRAIGAALDAWWRWCAAPHHPRICTSAANPVLLVWASRRTPGETRS